MGKTQGAITANALCGAQGVRSQESELRMIESATRTDLIFVFFIAGIIHKVPTAKVEGCFRLLYALLKPCSIG